MKLLFYIHAMAGGGAERVMSTLINMYVDHGDEVYLATDTNINSVFDIKSSVKIIDLYKDIDKSSTSCIYKFKKYYLRLRNIRKIATQIKPDVAISFLVDMNYDVILGLLGTGIPVVCSEHTNVSYYHGHKSMIFRRLLYPFANAITVLTRRDYKLWRNKYRNVVYMPNPVSSLKFANSPLKQNIILSAGRLNDWNVKGIDTLLTVWGGICAEFSEWRLCIAGKSDEESKKILMRKAELAHAKNVDFLGFCPNIGEIMSNAKVYCLTSRREGLPMVLIEAMQAGCCCVAFDCVTGPAEIITNNLNGLLVENQNIESMQLALKSVLSNETLRNKLANNSHSVIERYSKERIFNRWAILFNKIITS